jgi:arylsulfatase A-like enzyme
MAGRGPDARGHRGWTVLLVALALTLPLGAWLQPWLVPSRSSMPAVARRLDEPVVLVTVAGLRADRVHHLGHARGSTPALDDLARHGVSFSRAFATSNDAIATLAALHTGACPARTGVRSAGDALPPHVGTLAERFASQGYHTLGVVAHPDLPGRGLERGFLRFEALPGAPADDVLERALALLEAAPDNRTLLWVDLADLLPPYGGPALDARRFAPDAPADFGADPADYGLDGAALAARGWGERERAWMEARYDAALAALDASLGRFLDRLDETMRLQTMLLVVCGTRGERLTADDGPSFAHGTDLHDESLRVPLVVRLPAQVVRDLLLDRLVSTLDVGPTLAGRLGGRFGWTGTQGKDLDAAMRFRQTPHALVLSEGMVRPAGEPAWRGFVMRLTDHKYVTDAARFRRRLTLPGVDPDERDPRPLGPIQVQAFEERGGPLWAQCARE